MLIMKVILRYCLKFRTFRSVLLIVLVGYLSIACNHYQLIDNDFGISSKMYTTGNGNNHYYSGTIDYSTLKNDLKELVPFRDYIDDYMGDVCVCFPNYAMIKFGRYEQDNIINNGQENIEWFLLKRADNKALLMSKYVLDTKIYKDNSANLNWETSLLNKWLNDYFLNNSFNTYEKDILYKYRGDYVTILDGNEFVHFFNDELLYPPIDEMYRPYPHSMAIPTKYALKNNSNALECVNYNLSEYYGEDYNIDNHFCNYWLKNSEDDADNNNALIVSVYGNTRYVSPNEKGIGVRPVICIDLDKIK